MTVDASRRHGLLSLVLLLLACRGGTDAPSKDAAPAMPAANDADEPAPEAKATAKLDAGPEPDAGPKLDAGPEPDAVEDVIAIRNGVPLSSEVTREEIERRWPGVKTRQDPDIDAIEVMGPDGEALVRIHRFDPEWEAEVCITGRGVADATGLAVGTTLADSKIAERTDVLCQVATGEEVLHLSDPCPGLDTLTLVCSLDDGRRLYFGLDRRHAGRDGEEVRADGLAAFGGASLRAVLTGVPALDDGEPEPDLDEPEPETPSLPSVLGAVLARTTTDPPLEIRAGMMVTKASLQAALPGLVARPRRNGGYNLHRGEARLASVWARPGHPLEGISLDGPGIVDGAGIEVGSSFETVAKLEGLACAVEAGEDCYVVCSVEGSRSAYVFDLPCVDELFEGDLHGPVELSQARRVVGGRALTGISIDPQEP